MDELEIDVTDEDRREQFDILADIIQKQYVNNYMVDEFNENLVKIKLTKEEKNGNIRLTFTLDPISIDIEPHEKKLYKKVNKILETQVELPDVKVAEPSKYTLNDILKQSWDLLVEKIKKFTNKKYKTLGGVRFDYINFLRNESLLDYDFESDLDSIYFDEKLFKRTLNDDTIKTKEQFLQKYKENISENRRKIFLESKGKYSEDELKQFNEHILDTINNYSLNNNDKIERIKDFLFVGANIHYKDDMPLILAVENSRDNPELVEFLVDNGANVNAKKGLPLLIASRGDSIKIAQLLLKNGARTDLNNSEELMNAASDELRQLLIDYGADINQAIENFKREGNIGWANSLKQFRDERMIK